MPIKSDFMAAEEIKAILHGRDKIEQERIMRWVGESLSLVATVAGIVERIAPSTSTNLEHVITQQAGTGRAKDIKSFVGEKKPKSDMQVAAVVAYFSRFEAPQAERKDAITAKDLQDASRQARGFGFNNALTTLNNAVAQGYFDRGGRGEFKLNAVGENLVAMALPGTGADTGGKKLSRPKNKRTTKQKNSGGKKTKAS